VNFVKVASGFLRAAWHLFRDRPARAEHLLREAALLAERSFRVHVAWGCALARLGTPRRSPRRAFTGAGTSPHASSAKIFRFACAKIWRSVTRWRASTPRASAASMSGRKIRLRRARTSRTDPNGGAFDVLVFVQFVLLPKTPKPQQKKGLIFIYLISSSNGYVNFLRIDTLSSTDSD
jgi:hypothetical protein